jgi:hypothetical protein
MSTSRRSRARNVRFHVLILSVAFMCILSDRKHTCDATWPNLRRELDRIAVGTFTGPAGTFRQRTETSPAQLDILARLGIDPPPKIYQLTPAGPLTSANTPPRYTPSS